MWFYSCSAAVYGGKGLHAGTHLRGYFWIRVRATSSGGEGERRQLWRASSTRGKERPQCAVGKNREESYLATLPSEQGRQEYVPCSSTIAPV